MEIIKQVKEQFLQNKQDRIDGKYNGIPWYHVYPRLGALIPVIPRKTQILWTANSGVGKSQSWIGMMLGATRKLKKIGIPIKARFLIALLEDTKEVFITRLFSHILYEDYGLIADGMTLNSMRENPLNINIIDKLDAVEKEIESLLEYCEICDNIYHPTGLYKWCRAISNKLGTHYTKIMTFTNDKNENYEQEVYSHYIPNDPEEQVILIVDNLNNLSDEAGKTQLQTINLWSRSYCRLQIYKHFGWTIVNVIQQSADSDKQQFDVRGNSIISKIIPSLDGIGNSKECARDHMLILGLFAPARYGILQYPERNGYDITKLKDRFRSLIILKSNISECNKEIPLYFRGEASIFLELPKIEDITITKYTEYCK